MSFIKEMYMSEVWVVQTNENRHEVLDIFDNKDAAYKCADYYGGWIGRVFPMNISTAFIEPEE
jgi:hypothetical protein